MTDNQERVNLLNFDRHQLRQWFQSIGEKAFRGDQLFQWLHEYGVTDFNAMTNISHKLRQRLSEIAIIEPMPIVYEQASSDGTYKWLLRLDDGNCIETVYIPESTRGTLCVSSQVGCGLNCSFCSTGQQGFNRNLSIAEIIGQLWVAVRSLSDDNGRHDHAITNVVMMGMGEPLLNTDAVISAMDIMRDDFAYGLSKYRVTLSTSGVIPAMKQLKQRSDVALAVSLHAPNDAIRDILVPLNKKYPIDELMAVCRDYFSEQPRRKVTFEYVMLAGVNDQDEHAYELCEVLKDVPAKVNLIPFNTFPGTAYECSSDERIDRFQKILMDHGGLHVFARKTRGDDIDAACGQLVGKVKDRTQRSKKRLIAQRAEKHVANLKQIDVVTQN